MSIIWQIIFFVLCVLQLLIIVLIFYILTKYVHMYYYVHLLLITTSVLHSDWSIAMPTAFSLDCIHNLQYHINQIKYIKRSWLEISLLICKLPYSTDLSEIALRLVTSPSILINIICLISPRYYKYPLLLIMHMRMLWTCVW